MSHSFDKKFYLRHIALAVIILLLVATLPFHYVIFYERIKVIPKEHFTFSNTVVTEEDIEKIIIRYNSENFLGKIAIRNEPLVKKLFENATAVP